MGRKSRSRKTGQTATENVSETRPSDPASVSVRSYFPLWPSLHILLIILLSLLAYSNTFESSFHFDDEGYIVENPTIRDLHHFTQPASVKDFKGKYHAFKHRYIGLLTFALNYRLHDLNVAGYHLVNLSVHICTSILLYFFIILTFKTPFLRNSSIRDYERHIALFTALLFACHPLQTQAVTYIWQRVTSLCTMFYMLSLVAYIKWRLITEKVRGDGQEAIGKALSKDNNAAMKTSAASSTLTLTYYVLSLMSAILAMKTKQIAFMLPVMLMLYEFIFFRAKIKKRVLYLIPFIITMMIVPLTLLNIDKPIGEMAGDFDKTFRGNTEFPRGEYLITEFRVMVTYLRLIFLPVHQNLDHDYPRYHSFFQPEVFSSFIFLALIFGFSVYILFRYRDSAPHTRLISFGIIWFFINLMIESSIVPLNNVIFEHRMYLPSVGVFLALTTAIYMAIDRWKAYTKVITAILAGTVIVLTGATYARNSVWKDDITLWQDVVNKSPNKTRGYNNLGKGYFSNGLIDKAIEQYHIAIKIDPDMQVAHSNLGYAYKTKGFIDKAIEHLLIAISLAPDFPEAHFNLGGAYDSKGLIDKAIEHYQIAIRIDPKYVEAHNNLGVAYKSQGLIEKAIEQLQIAISLKPDYPDAHNNLGLIYESQGMVEKAMEESQMAISLKPHNPEAHINLAVVYIKQGRFDDALNEAREAIRLDANNADAYNNLSTVYRKLGRHGEAIKAAEQALNVKPGYAVPYNNLGLVYAETRQFNKAIDAFNNAVNLDHDYTEAYSNLGALYLTLGKYQDAIEVFKKAVEINPDYINSRFNLGVAYFSIGEREAAMKEYGFLKELSPEHAKRLWSFINRNGG